MRRACNAEKSKLHNRKVSQEVLNRRAVFAKIPIEQYKKYVRHMKLQRAERKQEKASKIMNNTVRALKNLLDDANRLLFEARKGSYA